jgi:hypothetical protein
MNADFVQEIVEDKRPSSVGGLTGWEMIVFQLEDVPDPDCLVPRGD